MWPSPGKAGSKAESYSLFLQRSLDISYRGWKDSLKCKKCSNRTSFGWKAHCGTGGKNGLTGEGAVKRLAEVRGVAVGMG